jgi:hypothetical protein
MREKIRLAKRDGRVHPNLTVWKVRRDSVDFLDFKALHQAVYAAPAKQSNGYRKALGGLFRV